MNVTRSARSRGGIYALAAIAATGLAIVLSSLGPRVTTIEKYLPHGFCYQWQPNLIRLHLVSDVLIGLAYLSIPMTLWYFMRRRADLPFNWMFLLFGVFIVACGATHWMEVWTLWQPDYWQAGYVKAVTAAASVPTAIMLIMLVPQALAIPSTVELRLAKEALEKEILERQRVEAALREAQATLERRVAERTAQLEQANSELEEQRRLLKTADRSKDDFIAILSHELRNPVHAIGTAAQVLKSRGSLDAAAGRAHAAIERQVRHLGRLLNDLLDVSRITHNKLHLERAATDLNSLVHGCVLANAHLATEKQHRVKVKVPEGRVWIHADPVRIEQVLSNLLHNAVKYTGPGGAIDITVAQAGASVQLVLEDTGVGISEDERDGLFRIFAQGRRAERLSDGGLGVGLYLAKTLIDLHGGTIDVSPGRHGAGTRFVVTLPAHARSPEDAQAPAVRQLRASRMLVVDDNEDAADSLATLLRLDGHEVVVAYRGSEALERLREERFDVALVDIGLPGISGYDMVESARREPQCAHTLFVAVTGWGTQDDKAKAAASGFHAHLTKPADHADLTALLASLNVS